MGWFTGMITLFQFKTIQSGQGVGNEFIYIISAVVGGCLLTGGYGSAVGAAIGALIFGMVNQGIVYAGWDPGWFTFFLLPRCAAAGRDPAEYLHPSSCGGTYMTSTSLRDMNPPNPAFLACAGAFFVDVTIHDLDTARWMIGEIVEVTAHGAALSDRCFADIGDIDTASWCSVSRTGRSG